MNADPRWEIFLQVHSGLPREAPGDFASTRRALELAASRRSGGAPVRRVLDVACGPGMQTLHLAGLMPQARILAVDLHMPYLRELGLRCARAGAGGRVTPVCADMRRLPVAPESVDLVWCEGGAYLMGVAEALAAWRCLLRPGGAVAFTDAVWLRPDPPEAVRAFWTEYSAMADREGVRRRVRDAGLDLIGDFVLPPSAWWDEYYGPLEQRLTAFRERYADDPGALAVLAAEQREIDLYRRYGDYYGYAFFVACAER